MTDSKKIDDGGPAFPTIHGYVDSFGSIRSKSDGLSLRDWFAGQCLGAVIGMLERSGLEEFKSMAGGRGLKWDAGVLAKLSAVMSYEIADAMIAARKAGG